VFEPYVYAVTIHPRLLFWYCVIIMLKSIPCGRE